MHTTEAVLKHLEMIQSVVARMASNSFFLKAWTVTLIVGAFALSAKDTNSTYLLVSLIPLGVFWTLDAYYLRMERQFRELYDRIRLTDPPTTDFSMTPPSDNLLNRWLESLISPSQSLFYLPLLGLTVMVLLLS